MSESQGREPTRKREMPALPILTALALQILALVIVYASLQVAWRLDGIQFTLPVAVLLQGAVAALLSWRRLPSWWMLIQFFLPLALAAAYALALPSWLFLAAFLLMLSLYWTTFRTRVPYYPSGPGAWAQVAELLPPRPLRVIDIGSGFGGLAFFLAGQRPDCRVSGIEIAPLPWAVSRLRAAWRRLRGEAAPTLLRGDYRQLDFADYDVIFAYLSPAAMPALWQQARAQMRAGSLLLSYEFELPGIAPQLSIITPGGRRLHGWRL